MIPGWYSYSYVTIFERGLHGRAAETGWLWQKPTIQFRCGKRTEQCFK